MPLPLSGILVADFSRVLAGPFCTQMLADAGARVIKIEEPSGGDETRRWGPPFAGGESAYFLSVNRNKESLALDLKSERGRAIAGRLIERADVVVENFRREQREPLGVSEARVHALNPRAILCSITGFESDGPDADVPGYDLLAQAAGGLMSITGEVNGQALKSGVAISDVLTAHYAFGAITAALYAREKTGAGESIEVSLFGATVASLVNVAQSYLVTRKEPKRWGNAHPSIVPYQGFDASDGMFVLGVGTDRQFETLSREILDTPELARDWRFSTNDARVQHRAELISILQEVFAGQPRDSWVARCRIHSIPAAVVAGLPDIFQRTSLTVPIRHARAGTYDAVKNPVRSSSGSAKPSAPPLLGEHTSTILRELGVEEE
ncbi:MAG TPA: CoA transferase [Thermoanaerobaculia bacterium]|nr:CoA transferase [Thermoanaerobaculia bacterium]